MTRKSKEERAAILTRICAIDVLSEKQLQDKIDLWKERLADTQEKDAGNSTYLETCKKMIQLYERRLSRLGVRLTCAD